MVVQLKAAALAAALAEAAQSERNGHYARGYADGRQDAEDRWSPVKYPLILLWDRLDASVGEHGLGVKSSLCRF
jgi:hypothetical protein